MVGKRVSAEETSCLAPRAGWSAWWGANPLAVPLAAGAVAGMAVEVSLFPLDCLKTRLQSGLGFCQAGGLRSLYRGVGVTAAGAVPTSAVFFCTYELSKERLGSLVLASVVGELAACGLRAPVDLAKQRLQAGLANDFVGVARGLLLTPGSVIFASFRVSAARDIVHSGLQYPMYEYLKLAAASRSGSGRVEDLPTWQAATCGSAAGAISAIATTPLDLLRTRLNLRMEASPSGLRPPAAAAACDELRLVLRSSGLRGLFAGAACRASWMGMGGFVFLGSFELVRKRLHALVEADGQGSQPARHPDARVQEPHHARRSRAPAHAARGGPRLQNGLAADGPCWM